MPAEKKRGESKGAEPEDEDEEASLDMAKLQRVVHLLFERCYADGAYGHAGGLVILWRRILA